MTTLNTPATPPTGESTTWKVVLNNAAYILAALFIFLFALDLMIASLQHIGSEVAEIIILATSNPFTGLFIGLLITALIQSSSATISMIVALVASGSISLDGAIPILMGANIGTTITSTIVSLGFITRKKEFKRAVAIGTYHDFFNIMTTIVLFPLQYYFGFLSGIANFLATEFFNQPLQQAQQSFSLLGQRFNFIITHIVEFIDNGFLLVVLSIAILFSSILFFRKVLSRTLGFGSQERFQQFFFKSGFKSFSWGLLTTAAIRSSTVTTSLVVPLVAKKIVKIKSAYPFVAGANIGTTVTAFIAAAFNSNAAINIAIAHFLFNAIGVIIFLPIPGLNKIPVKLAEGLGKLTLKYRLAVFLYLLLMFFFLPFSLIYINKGSVDVEELTYKTEDFETGKSNTYSLIAKTYLNQPISQWVQHDGVINYQKSISIYRRKNLMQINQELYELNKPGFCRDDEDEYGKYKMCIREILPKYSSANLTFDSVYVFEKQWYQPEKVDSTSVYIYISKSQNKLLQTSKYNPSGKLLWQEVLQGVSEK